MSFKTINQTKKGDTKKMIKLNNGYYINADRWNYILKKSHSKEGIQDKMIGYYSTLENAVMGYYDLRTKKQIQKEEQDLKKAIEELKNIKEDLKNAVQNINTDLRKDNLKV